MYVRVFVGDLPFRRFVINQKSIRPKNRLMPRCVSVHSLSSDILSKFLSEVRQCPRSILNTFRVNFGFFLFEIFSKFFLNTQDLYIS